MKNILLFFFVFVVSYSFGQSTDRSPYYSENGVEVYLNFRDCISPERGTAKQYLFIEINNNSAVDIKISFNKEIWYDSVCQTCNSSSLEYKINLEVPANGKIKGDCDSKSKSLKIFSKMLNLEGVRQLTKYELKNISIESIK